MACKITLIGAGSVVFAKRLIGDILQFPELSDATICLMDIDPARLKVAEAMTQSIISVLGVKAKVQATLDQREAVRGARYVICTIQVGGYKPGTVIDFEIPAKYGLRQTIADTLGVGGVFRALRTIPVINSIAKDMAEVGAKGAMLLNYTNPMAMNCMAVDWEVGIPTVGLCHSVQGTSEMLASHLGLPYKDITYQVAGINHMAFFLKFEYRGQDAYPLLFKFMENPGRTVELVRYEMMRRTGYFVTESSEHQSEYLPYFIHHGDEVIEKFKIPINEYIRRCEAIIASWEKQERELLGGEAGQIKVEKQSHEYGAYIIHSRETNKPRVVYGNVPNTGLITNLPNRCCVELPVLVDGVGLQPTFIGDLPPQLAAVCRTNINVQELTVHAALSNKRENIYHAVMLDPHTSSTLRLDQIWAMCDELIEAHQKVGLLKDFKPAVKNTGRGYAGTGDRLISKLATTQAIDPAPGVVNELVLSVENPREEPVVLPFTINGGRIGAEIVDGEEITVKALPGQTVTTPVRVKFPAGLEAPVFLDLSTESTDTIAFGVGLSANNQFDLRDGKPATFNLFLGGERAVSGRFRAFADRLRVTLEVADSKVTPEDTVSRAWSGSCLELFFAQSAAHESMQFLVIPQPEGTEPRLADGRKDVYITEGIKATQAITPISYTVNLEIPWAAIGLSGDADSFLFDAIAMLSALGDAHSGGRTSLNGGFDAFWTTKDYSKVVLK
jgi:alpha-galactosidase/6-phospho-beta-glucosidase family protein